MHTDSSCWWPSHSDLVMKSCWSYRLMIVRPPLFSQFGLVYIIHAPLIPSPGLSSSRNTTGSMTSFHIILPNLESSETRMKSRGWNESRRNRRDIFMRSASRSSTRSIIGWNGWRFPVCRSAFIRPSLIYALQVSQITAIPSESWSISRKSQFATMSKSQHGRFSEGQCRRKCQEL